MSSRLQLVLQQSRSRRRIGHYTFSRITKIGILLSFLSLRLITIKLLRYRLDLIALIIAVANSVHSHGRRKRGRSEILIISIAPYPGLWPWPVILVLESLWCERALGFLTPPPPCERADHCSLHFWKFIFAHWYRIEKSSAKILICLFSFSPELREYWILALVNLKGVGIYKERGEIHACYIAQLFYCRVRSPLRDGPGERCIFRVSRSSQGTADGGAVCKWGYRLHYMGVPSARCRRDVIKQNQPTSLLGKISVCFRVKC